MTFVFFFSFFLKKKKNNGVIMKNGHLHRWPNIMLQFDFFKYFRNIYFFIIFFIISLA